ncbi:hypothetical protein COV15_02170 [Candidatus Woesearchaeota archaeon CG10_big_fil_rev_8_21_14_0_10_34_12]|nr:MAG: hypothetical protein COV15_02170 [Candidatus Woesearchaeota archaeon CG10_big_fil_rev_8_21_14_0_10_34_12]
MRLKRAILCGALLWILIFFEVSILMFGFNITSGPLYYTVHYILLIFLAGLAALVYFRGRVDRGFWQGILVGIIMAVTGVVLDSIITVPLFIKSYSFFANSYLWTGIIEGIIIVGIVGLFRK